MILTVPAARTPGGRFDQARGRPVMSVVRTSVKPAAAERAVSAHLDSVLKTLATFTDGDTAVLYGPAT